MKRMLVLLALITLSGVNALGFSLSGTWSTELSLLPSPGLERTTLELSTSFAGWAITSESLFETDAFVHQGFGMSGVLAFVSVEGSMAFSPIDTVLRSVPYVIGDRWSGFGFALKIEDGRWIADGPSFRVAELLADLDLLGVKLGLDVMVAQDYLIELDAKGVLSAFLLFPDFPTYIIGDEDWTLTQHPTMPPRVVPDPRTNVSSYFFAIDHAGADIGMMATRVTFEGVDLDGDPVRNVLQDTFEVYYYNAATREVVLTMGADTYLWAYIAQYGARNDWDLEEEITYEVDLDSLKAVFLFPTYMTYTLSAEAEPFRAEIVFEDVCTGILLHSATLAMDGMPLCCGITYDAELSFLKGGFDYLKVSVSELFSIMDYWTYDLSITYGVDFKSVGVDVAFDFPLDICMEFYMGSDGLFDIAFEGFTITCALDDCSFVEFITFLPQGMYTDTWEELGFEGYEFEYIKLGLCGPGCCGSAYTVGLAVFLENDEDDDNSSANGRLFGMSRFLGEFSVPIMNNFSIEAEFGYHLITNETNLALGWTFSF